MADMMKLPFNALHSPEMKSLEDFFRSKYPGAGPGLRNLILSVFSIGLSKCPACKNLIPLQKHSETCEKRDMKLGSIDGLKGTLSFATGIVDEWQSEVSTGHIKIDDTAPKMTTFVAPSRVEPTLAPNLEPEFDVDVKAGIWKCKHTACVNANSKAWEIASKEKEGSVPKTLYGLFAFENQTAQSTMSQHLKNHEEADRKKKEKEEEAARQAKEVADAEQARFFAEQEAAKQEVIPKIVSTPTPAPVPASGDLGREFEEFRQNYVAQYDPVGQAGRAQAEQASSSSPAQGVVDPDADDDPNVPPTFEKIQALVQQRKAQRLRQQEAKRRADADNPNPASSTAH